MTLDIILGILVIVGTIAGTGLGYALSMRGKREEWAKEYREKRLSPLIDHLNEVMGLIFRLSSVEASIAEAEQKLKESIDNEQKERDQKDLAEKKKEILRTAGTLETVLESEAWSGWLAACYVDKELTYLTRRWSQSHVSYIRTEDETKKNDLLMELMTLATAILARADEVIITGGKTPRTTILLRLIPRRLKKTFAACKMLITRVWKKNKGSKNELHLL